MIDPITEHYDRADALRDRIDALFPAKDGGYGDDMRRMMRLADHHAHGWTMDHARSIHAVLSELVGRMEQDEQDARDEDAYWSAIHDATIGA